MSNEGYDDDKPKDEFLFYKKVFKIEEKKVLSSLRWEQVTAVYWQLLRNMPEQDSNKNTISQHQYTELLKRMYKVLLPLYRDSEMNSEIAQEWLMDCRGQDEISQNILGKILYRVAHWWSTNNDMEEYVELLYRIYYRITFKRVYDNRTEKVTDIYPLIHVTFPVEEININENVVRGGVSENNDWMECASNESNKSDYEYKYEEDPARMIVKKLKKRKAIGGLGAGGANQTIKEPFIYDEEVQYPDINDHRTDFNYRSTYDQLLDLKLVFPFGYPTEQLLRQIKQDIHSRIEEVRAQIKRSNPNAEEDEEALASVSDPGLISNDTGSHIDITVNGWGLNGGVKVVARLTDTLLNKYRKQLRDGVNMTLRLYSQFPKTGQRGKRQSTKDEPQVEINKFGYNPALERRLAYKFLPAASKNNELQYINVNYLIAEPDFETAYRSDVQRIETRGKMAIKESDEIKRDEEFNAVEASYRKVRQVMLQKKFETLHRDHTQAETNEQRRWAALVEAVEKDKRAAMRPGPIAQKGLKETYEDKSFIKMMRGPFSSLDSKEGLREDNFHTCAEEDLINAARTDSLRLLVIGKPRSGKTNLSKNLAQRLDLVHINVDNWLAALLAKIKAYEPPEDLEEGQEPPRFLSDLEEAVHKALQAGSGPTDAQIVEILRTMVHSPQAVLKGFVLDLSFYERQGKDNTNSDNSWAGLIKQVKLLGSHPDGKLVEFTHIIDLFMEDEEIRLRAHHMRVDPTDGNLYSRWEREERKKPKPKKEGEEEDAAEEEENVIKPLDELALVQRVNDTEDRVRVELSHYNSVERPAIEELLINFYEDQFIRLDAAGLTPEQLTDAVQCKLKPDEGLPLRPLALQIEGAGDFKSLLTEGLEENHLPRKWSLWRTYDPVALFNGKVIQGAAEFACHYNGNVFVFATEENLKAFMLEPKKFIKSRPAMPNVFRILMLGPKGAGKHTQAKLLSDIYGWKIVDFRELIRTKLEELMKAEHHLPNNPLPGGKIGLSEHELAEVIEGKPFAASKYIPWILNYLGYPLMKKRPPPVQADGAEGEGAGAGDEDLDEETKKKKEAEAKKKAQEEEKKRREEEERQNAKQERRLKRQAAKEAGHDLHELGLDESEEETVIIEDLSIDQIVLKTDEVTGKGPLVGGFILLGFPETQDQIEKLKQHGIEFDKIIFLNDTNEENPGEEIRKRNEGIELYDFEYENEISQKTLALAKEHLGEENVREISCNGKPEVILRRIISEIDPFCSRYDNPDDVRNNAELGEEDKRLPKGDFGDYCPVTFVDEGWLVRGNPEQEVSLNGKTYILAGEKEAEKFKFEPSNYLISQSGSSKLPIEVPPPRIMVMGHRGAGTTTIIRMICEKFKLEEFELKNEYLKKLKEEKEKRKRARLLNRGFRPPPPADEETGEVPPDPEIEDDPEDFDKEGHERQVMKLIYESKRGQGLVIDGSWRDLPEGAVGQSIQDLLFESRRVPEIVVILKCKEAATFQRLIKFDDIKAEFNRLMENRAKERARVREEERQKRLAELKADEEKTPDDVANEMAKWEEEQDAAEEAADEGDPDKPDLEAMIEKEREVLREARTADDAMFEELSQALKDKLVFVVDDIRADTSADFVLIKLLDRIKDNLQYRKDIIERQLALPLKPEEVKFFEKSYIYKHSKFGLNSPLNISNPSKTKRNTVLYRERLYFLSNQDEQQRFLKEPSKFTQQIETVPLDVPVKPRAFVIGLPKSGKSTLCKMLAEKIGVVHIKLPALIQFFMDQDSAQGEYLRRQLKYEGRQLEDDTLVSLIMKRIQMKDCVTNGWVIEDFPKTRNQALFMAKRGLVPTNIFYMKQSIEETYKRTHARADDKFGCIRTILATRIKTFQENQPHVCSFYQRLYNNFIEIDSSKSKWFIEDRALTHIQRNVEARQVFARDYYLREKKPGVVCKWRDLNMDRCLVKQSLSEFRYYCPVTWKNEKLLVKCHENVEDCLLYNNAFYFFKSSRERDLFLANPTRFVEPGSFLRSHDLPLRAMPHKACEAVVHEKALSAHCPVCLTDEDRVRKGDVALLIVYKDDKFVFDSEFKLQRFLANPFKYSRAALPVKMPPPEDKVSLYNLQKMEDSISFMEQALGHIVTRGLREVSENRLKYPTLSLKETMLKLFALFLKTENPANTESMKRKYAAKMKQFIQRCELPEELYDLAMEKDKKKPKGQWPEFKENYYNDKGAEYDAILKLIDHERLENFINYIR